MRSNQNRVLWDNLGETSMTFARATKGEALGILDGVRLHHKIRSHGGETFLPGHFRSETPRPNTGVAPVHYQQGLKGAMRRDHDVISTDSA